ncbi:MAG: squalene/phytoene synthase family protein, partial [Chloroflexota bacterium]
MAVITNETWDRPLLSLAQEAWQVVAPVQPEDAADTELLQQAYDHCESITAFHSRSFHMASSLLSGEQRQAVRALYAFCRTTDDIVDDHARDASILLQTWRERSLTWHPPRHDLVAFAWADARARHDIPQRYAEQLIDGVARDMVQNRYETFEDLTTYC